MFTTYSLMPSTNDRIFHNIFDEWFKDEKSEKYPVSNIYTIGPKTIIEIATTGFSEDEINVSVDKDKLTITAESTKSEDAEAQYIVRRIAKRNFVKEYTLLKKVDSINATMKNGILSIELIPENKETKKVFIPINKAQSSIENISQESFDPVYV